MNHAQLLGGCQESELKSAAFRISPGLKWLFSQLQWVLLKKDWYWVNLRAQPWAATPFRTILLPKQCSKGLLLADVMFFLKAAFKHTSCTTELACLGGLTRPECIQSSETMLSLLYVIPHRNPTPMKSLPCPPLPG